VIFFITKTTTSTISIQKQHLKLKTVAAAVYSPAAPRVMTLQ